jgi:hypothetical protein
LCGDPVGLCKKADCETSADCAAGFDCLATPFNCVGEIRLRCQVPADQCKSDADCSTAEYCGVGTEGNLVCKPAGCGAIGRPFLVDGVARVAATAERRDYTWECEPRLDGLSAAERALLARHWQQVGLMEHASIAAFARFGLQLLALGAPLELVHGSNQAQADETEHAAIAFALASRYGGTAVGPGPLELSGALRAMGLRSVLADVIVEGCIGETLASLEAAHAANCAADPAVRELLGRIAKDEERHARLAWRFVTWVLRQHPELGSFARAQFGQAMAAARPRGAALRGDRNARRLALGIVDGMERAQLHQDALERVVAVCAERVCAGGVAQFARVASAAANG